MRRPMLAAVALTLMAACTSGISDYSDFKNLPPEGWAYGDRVDFVPVMTDSVAHGSLSVALRHNNEYIYRNLWIEVSRWLPDGQLACDTFNLTLADSYGRWQGHGFGASYQQSVEIAPSTELIAGSPVRVRHIMRVDTLDDVEQLGIIFVSSK